MSKEDINVKVTPEALAEAYKILGVSLEKSDNPEIEKSYEEEGVGDDGKEDSGGEDAKPDMSGSLNAKDKKKKKKNKIKKAFKKLSKGLDSKLDALVTINKSLTDQLGQHKETLEKAQERIEELENIPAGRKSIITQNFIEKAFTENEGTGKKMVSVSQHRTELQGLLISKAGLDGDSIEKANIDSFWQNEMEYFEATNSLHPKAIEKLFKDDNIQLVK